MKFYYTQVDDVLENLKSSRDGLSTVQAQERLQASGQGKSPELKQESQFARFAEQFAQPQVIILLAAATFGVAFGGELVDAATTVLLLAAGAVIGLTNAARTTTAFDRLAKLHERVSRIVRDGNIVTIKNSEIVSGDIVMLEAGVFIPADGRIIDTADLIINETAVTSAQEPARKNTDALVLRETGVTPEECTNMCFAGSTVVQGRGRMVVTSIEKMETFSGIVEDESSLVRKLSTALKCVNYAVTAACVFILLHILVSAGVGGDFAPQTAVQGIMVAASLAYAALPVGLAVLIVAMLAEGALKISQANVLIKRLSAVTTLGCMQVIAIDKADLLTGGDMQVIEVEVSDDQLFAAAVALCSNAKIAEDGTVLGSPEDAALVKYAVSAGQDKAQLSELFPCLIELEYDDRKRMTTVHNNDGRIIQFTKGTVCAVLSVCTHILIDGDELEITNEDLESIAERVQAYEDMGLSVVAVAFKEYNDEFPEDVEDKLEGGAETIESEMCFVGIAGLLDPIREDAIEIIANYKAAGIIPILFSPDNKSVAATLANQLDITEGESRIITGLELQVLNPAKLEKCIDSIDVYAEVTPSDKQYVLNVLRHKGYVCAATASSIDDLAGLQEVSLGIAMLNNVDVIKDDASVILTDNNIASLVPSVAASRRICDNIKTLAAYMLTTSLARVLTVFIAYTFGFMVFLPSHLLLASLLVLVFPAAALAFGTNEAGTVDNKPRVLGECLFSNGLGTEILCRAGAGAVLVTVSYLAGVWLEAGELSFAASQASATMAFVTLSFYEAVIAVSSSQGKANNKLYSAVAMALAAALVVACALPLVYQLGFAAMTAAQLAVAIALGVATAGIIKVSRSVNQILYKVRP